MKRIAVTVRLLPASHRLLLLLARCLGLSQAGVMALALRRLAQSEAIELPLEDPPQEEQP